MPRTSTRKKATRKTTARRKSTTTKRKATTAKRKTATRKPAAKRSTKVTRKKTLTPIKTAMTKSQVLAHIAEETELTRKQVGAVFESLQDVMSRHLKKGSCNQFTLPGLAKFVTKHKPATKARKGINPFTGEEMMFKAKPASKTVKVRPLKTVKEMPNG